MSFRNGSFNLSQNGLTEFIQALPKNDKNVTVSIYNESSNAVGTIVRLDASWDDQATWVNSIALSDPTAAIGAAYLTTLALGKVGETQDRLFGATHIRIVRTDANAGTAKVTGNFRNN